MGDLELTVWLFLVGLTDENEEHRRQIMVNTDLSPLSSSSDERRPARSSSAAMVSTSSSSNGGGGASKQQQTTPNRHAFPRSAGVSPAKSSSTATTSSSSNMSIADLLLLTAASASSPAAGGGPPLSTRSLGSSVGVSEPSPDRLRKEQQANLETQPTSGPALSSVVVNPLLSGCDLLTCGECQRQFRLADITNFIHHKVRISF